jgi:hypothetical protein
MLHINKFSHIQYNAQTNLILSMNRNSSCNKWIVISHPHEGTHLLLLWDPRLLRFLWEKRQVCHCQVGQLDLCCLLEVMQFLGKLLVFLLLSADDIFSLFQFFFQRAKTVGHFGQLLAEDNDFTFQTLLFGKVLVFGYLVCK